MFIPAVQETVLILTKTLEDIDEILNLIVENADTLNDHIDQGEIDPDYFYIFLSELDATYNFVQDVLKAY